MNSLKQLMSAGLSRVMKSNALKLTLLAAPLLFLMPELAYASTFDPLNRLVVILRGLIDIEVIAVFGTLALLIVLYRIWREKTTWEEFIKVLVIIALAAAVSQLVAWAITWFR